MELVTYSLWSVVLVLFMIGDVKSFLRGIWICIFLLVIPLEDSKSGLDDLSIVLYIVSGTVLMSFFSMKLIKTKEDI